MNKLSKTLVCSLMLVTLAGCAKGNGLGTLSNSKLAKLAYEESIANNIVANTTYFTNATNITFPFSGSPIVMYGNDVTNTRNSGIIMSSATVYGTLSSNDGLYYCGNSSGGFIFNRDGLSIHTLKNPLLGVSMSVLNSVYLDYGTYKHVYLQDGLQGDNFYYKVIDSTATEVTADEFNSAAENGSIGASSFVNFKDIGINSSNKFLSDGNNSLMIYNKNGKYVGSIPSFVLGSNMIYGKDATLFTYGYQTKQASSGTATTYNSYCYTINVDNATWKYEEGLQYIIKDSVQYFGDNGYIAGSFVTVTPLSKDKTTYMPYYEIRDFTTSASSSKRYAYDSIIDYDYVKIGKKAIAYSGTNAFYLSGNDRALIEGISSIVAANSEYVKYRTESGKYGVSTVDEFEKQIETGEYYEYDYASWNTYNGARLCYNSTSDGYALSDGTKISSDFTSYASGYGIVISGSNMYVLGGGNVLNFDSDIVSVTYASTFSSKETVFKVSASSGTKAYILYTVA